VKKLSAKLQNELIVAGHMVSVNGRWFISLEALKDVSGEPIVPEPVAPPQPPPSKRDQLIVEREEQHERQAAELDETAHAKVQDAVHPEQAAPAADHSGTEAGADGDRSQD
jgi:hypothetical protein